MSSVMPCLCGATIGARGLYKCNDDTFPLKKCQWRGIECLEVSNVVLEGIFAFESHGGWRYRYDTSIAVVSSSSLRLLLSVVLLLLALDDSLVSYHLVIAWF